MKLFRKIMWLLVIALIVIQFFHPEKNISSAASPAHISQKFPLPEDVKQIITTSCFDCHSNNTHYPWYFSVQPIAWWLADDIEEGKKTSQLRWVFFLQFTQAVQKIWRHWSGNQRRWMPLSTYTAIHRQAILSPEQKEKIIQWSEERMKEMKASYPADSLLKKIILSCYVQIISALCNRIFFNAEGGGPAITFPLVSNFPPWHGQLKVPLPNATVHPWWVHDCERAT